MTNDSPTTHRRRRFKDRLSAIIHKAFCADCRRSTAEWSRLSRGIDRLEDEQFPPSLDERLIADAMTASAEARTRQPNAIRSRASEAFRMRKAAYAAIAVVILILTGLSVYPRMQPGYALAQTARAMARIDSAHMVGWSLDRSGTKQKMEIWVKGEKTRMSMEGFFEESSDGKVKTTLIPGDQALIRPVDDEKPDLTLALFRGPDAVHHIIRESNSEVVGTRHTNLPDGQPALVTEVRGRDTRWLIFTDPRTDLVIRHEQYWKDGLYAASESFEYNAPIPDSVFEIQIPEGTPTFDLTVPVSPEKKEWRHKQHVQLYQQGAKLVTSLSSGEDDTQFHPGYKFQCLSAGGLIVYYLPDEDLYWILGIAEVTGPNGFSQIVEDDTIRLSSKTSKANIYEVLMDNGKPGAFCDASKTMIGGYECVRFVNIGDKPLTIKWYTARSLFIIEGKARVLPQGDVYTHQTVSFHASRLAKIEKPVWTGLPTEEAAVAQEEFDILKRRTALVKHEDLSGDNFINGGKVEYEGNVPGGMRRGHYKTGYGLSIEQVTRAQPYIFIVPSHERYYVVGTAKVKVKGQPDRIVKNGIVGFDGRVLETER